MGSEVDGPWGTPTARYIPGWALSHISSAEGVSKHHFPARMGKLPEWAWLVGTENLRRELHDKNSKIMQQM